MIDILKLLFREKLLREISKGRVGIFGSILILPRFVGFVILFLQDSFELILAFVRMVIH